MVQFFCEAIEFKPKAPLKSKRWIRDIAAAEGFSIQGLNYIFCSDDYLLQINKDYLQHDYYTDIISFDNSDVDQVIEGDIFISIDRVRENALTEKTGFDQELLRVLAHGILHLCGYDDHAEEDKEEMRGKENFYLSNYH